MSMLLNGGARPAAEMNVTPLIDVLLVLIIIFMVVLPVHQHGEKADIPQPSPSHPETKPDTPIVVRLHDVGEDRQPTLKVNQDPVAWDSLEQKLRSIYLLQARGEKVAFVKGDPEIDFEYVAQVVDMAHMAGADRVGLLGTKEMEAARF